jgi:GAF domain-containing protein
VTDAAPRPPASDAAPRPLTDPARLAAVEATGLLPPGAAAGGPDQAVGLEPQLYFERVARLAARALSAPVAQVNLITAAAQVPVAVAVAALADAEAWRAPVGLDRSYCQHVVDADAPLVVEDARVHPLVRDSAATRESGIVAYLSVPLRAPAGEPLGTVCVVDVRPRRWAPEDVTTLEDLAAIAADVVARRDAEFRARTLADAVPHVLWTTAPDGRVTSLNRRWYEYTGRTS